MWEYLRHEYGNVASVIGLCISIIGFIRVGKEATRAVAEARRARIEARNAIRVVSEKILYSQLAQAARLVTDLTQYCRSGDWAKVLDRGDALTALLAATVEHGQLAPDDQTALITAIDDLRMLAEDVEGIQTKQGRQLSRQMKKAIHNMVVLLGRLDGRFRDLTREHRDE